MTSEGYSTYEARICQRVREIRKLRGLSQGDVAAAIGMASDVYSRYEGNRRARGWSVSTLVDVADALEVPLSALVPGERVLCASCGASAGVLAHARLPAPDH